jgi:hypothetical protein
LEKLIKGKCTFRGKNVRRERKRKYRYRQRGRKKRKE